ncbi:MAG: TolC family protein [Candidatus Omnitrophota bacterium]
MKTYNQNIFVFTCALFLLLLFAYSVFGQDVLTWEDCVKESLKQNPDLISSRENIKQVKLDKDITLSSIMPELTSDVSGKRTKSASARRETNTFAYSLGIQQLLFDGFKTASDLGADEKTINAEIYNYAVVSSNVRLRLRSAFTGLLRAQELIPLTEEILKKRGQDLELVKLRYNAGREHKGALLTAEANLMEAEFEVNRAKRNLYLAEYKLTKELGRSAIQKISVSGKFEMREKNLEQPYFAGLADNTPFLKELIEKKEAARYDLAAAQADFCPQVYLNTSYSDTASNSSWPIKESDKAWSAQVSLSFPLFEGGSRIAGVSKSRSELNEAREDERSGRDGVILTLEETWKELKDAIDTAAVKQKFLEATKERSKIANAQYSSGLLGFDDWIIIENNLVTAKKAYLDAQADLLIAEAAWVQAIGGTLEYV